ncbi:TetR/AcrR family transcriptional regulator [Planococcus sp. 1R117A]|uniref:TetR/AcrR family transcriptional regulator n=1 Tax=Planococcus sp. 1R117A TaxID=3447020 RepID=UPI003EDC005E
MEKFKNLENKKKQTILNAALQEFAENGYQQASTNRIVKNAGIGKGMLFYYLESKRQL